LWERAEQLRTQGAFASTAEETSYYVAMVHLSARAANPPEGMVFVPGGWVFVPTAAGAKNLWVEPFFIDRYEVTVGQYGEFLAQCQADKAKPISVAAITPITGRNPKFNQPDLPVTGVNWTAAEAFDGQRLYACGDESALAGCNLKGPADGQALLAPAAACTADASPLDVLALTGNVREWTASWQAADAYVKTDPRNPQSPANGSMKIVLGGSWRTGPDAARLGAADALRPGEAFDDVGFRCVQSFFRKQTDPSQVPQPTQEK
jgi:formylglycine-generating enzyme required for sulfatase activity